MSPPAPDAGPGDDGGDVALTGRVLGMIALLALADLWIHHHFGVGIRNIGIPVGIAAALGLALKAAGFVFGDERVEASLRRVKDPLRSLLRRLVTPATLTTSALVLATAMLMISSVTVVADEQAPGTTVRVASLDGSGAGDAHRIDGAARTIPVWTSPFGRLFRLDASGFVGGTFTVYPPVGLRVRLGRDLPALPSVLFRPAPETLGFLADGAVLTVSRLGPDGPEPLAVDTGHVGSFLVGRSRAIPPGMVADWERELPTGGPEVRDAVNRTVLLWKDVQPLDHEPGRLRLGDVLQAEVRMGETLVGRGQVTLEGAELIDVPLERVAPG